MEYIYSMEDKFSDNNFVTRREENNIRYNSKVNFPIIFIANSSLQFL